jgi:predicted transposase YbfD/YdcC
MESKISVALEEHFSEVTDPRVERTKLHKLLDIFVIAICAVIAGADNWEDVETFGRAKLKWFQKFLELPNGIPSHDTFNRVFARLDAQEFQAGFVRWMNAVSEIIVGQVIAIDGKVLRRSHNKGIGKGVIDMVSAWAAVNHLVLGQVKVDDKSNEITAIPQLLQALEISGCIVTIDAMGCQTSIAEAIIEKKSDYVLALKENQGCLFEDVQFLFADLGKSQYKAYFLDYHKTLNKDHGRIETRECWIISDPQILCHLRGFENWDSLTAVSRIRSQRQIGEELSCEDRYHIIVDKEI